ncbi:MAG: hypothetical protein GC162_02720 [Planctomycetes bacterium]|nr:hypothetical protein [Planctomycetota bacterium]
MVVLAQSDMFRVQPEHYFMYIVLTAVFLFLLWFSSKKTEKIGMTLTVWGIELMMLGIGYSLLGLAPVMALAGFIMKVGFLLVLGGVSVIVLNTRAAGCSAGAETPKEADHV